MLTQVPIDARVVALNVTGRYLIDDQDRPFIKRIDDVFLYDRNERTHCCEWTPSHYLIYLYTNVVVSAETDDRKREALQEKYGYLPTDNCYVHCHEIDAIEKNARPFRYHTHGDPGFENARDEYETDEAWHDAVMDALREHFCCNCPL
jgi:hypothetical protein